MEAENKRKTVKAPTRPVRNLEETKNLVDKFPEQINKELDGEIS